MSLTVWKTLLLQVLNKKYYWNLFVNKNIVQTYIWGKILEKKQWLKKIRTAWK